jgi:hypothetical protein
MPSGDRQSAEATGLWTEAQTVHRRVFLASSFLTPPTEAQKIVAEVAGLDHCRAIFLVCTEYTDEIRVRLGRSRRSKVERPKGDRSVGCLS